MSKYASPSPAPKEAVTPQTTYPPSLGELSSERLESYRKLQREMLYMETRRDAAARAMENKRMRALHRSYKAIQRHNRKRKG